MGGAYGSAHGSPAQQPQHHHLHQQHQQQQYPQQQQAQQQPGLALTPARNASRALDFPRYCSRAAPALPTIHSFPSLEGMLQQLSFPIQALFMLVACFWTYVCMRRCL